MTFGYSYELLLRAEKEYLDSYLWYEEKQEGLGDRFSAAVRKKLEYIALNPSLNSKRKGNFRETQLGKPFPFVIIFIVDKKQKRIIVTSIFHTSRNPKKKHSKNVH